jgi:hypothetical protein
MVFGVTLTSTGNSEHPSNKKSLKLAYLALTITTNIYFRVGGGGGVCLNVKIRVAEPENLKTIPDLAFFFSVPVLAPGHKKQTDCNKILSDRLAKVTPIELKIFQRRFFCLFEKYYTLYTYFFSHC